jgi:hypothetical protein
MENNKVYDIVDFILNEATDAEVELIISAVKRRLEDEAHGLDKMNPEKMARQLGSQINQQVGASVDQIRSMVRNFVAEKIKQEAPEISEEQLDQLLKAWVPEPGAGQQRQEKSKIPHDVLLNMIEQFVLYSTGNMSSTEQTKLWEEIPNWQEKYWKQFPQGIRQSIALFVKGKVDEKTFWKQIDSELAGSS